MSCCPDGSWPYLAASYEAKGSVQTEGGVELYVAPVTGTPTSAVILCPDIWGWNGGRIRAVADHFASFGYLTVIPKLLTPARNGGTDGDAMAPDDTFDIDWIKQFPYDVQRPKVEAVKAFVKAKGATKIGVIGFCYGGHPACWASRESTDITCGVVFHPSMQLEMFAFGGDMKALIEGVQAPFLIAPAGNDLELFAEDTDFGKALKASAKGGECAWKPFPDMTHGWTCRGDLKEANVARDVELAMKAGEEFLKKYL